MEFRAVFFYTLVLFPNTAQSVVFELLHVWATYFSHHRGAVKLYRQKRRNMSQQMINIHTAALNNSQLMQSVTENYSD
jgi:hypothetical protein